MQGLERSLMILERLSEQPMRPKDLAESLGLKWTTAYRTLSFLRSKGFLVRDERTGIYSVGPRLFYVGSSYLANVPVVQAARGYLRLAADETGSAAQLVERFGYRAINLLVAESKTQVVPHTTIGFHFPLHCGSKGQVLLAFSPAEFIEEYLARPLERLTPHTITDPGELRDRLEQIREQGYATTKADIQLSTGSAASPIRDADGNVIAAMTLIVNAGELDRVKDELVAVVMRSSQAVSLLMGWGPAGKHRPMPR
jgi:DNA-binding IclR family transcriptional regulator